MVGKGTDVNVESVGDPLTFGHIPSKMPQSINGVECERQGNDSFGSIAKPFRNPMNKINDISRV